MPRDNKTKILVQRDTLKGVTFQVYSSLQSFIDRNPKFKYDTVRYHINRKKKPYKKNGIVVDRVPYFEPKKKKKCK